MDTLIRWVKQLDEILLMTVAFVVAVLGTIVYAILSIVYFLLPFAVVFIAYRLLFG